MTKEAYYFSHDSNARHDPNISRMLIKYKYGYQWYFMIIEILREQSDFKYKIDDYTYEALARELHEPADIIKNFINDCINIFNLLRSNGNFFWSQSLLKRMKKKKEKSETYKRNAEKRWKSKEKQDDKEMQLHSKDDAKGMHKRKGKERKGKENININIQFDVFWEAYEKKVGNKSKLEKKWESLTDTERKEIMDYVPKYIKAQPDVKFRKNPETFFNNRSWHDELIYSDDKFRNTETKEKEKPDYEKMANELVVKNLSELKKRVQQYDEYSPIDEANYLIKTYKPNIITACPTFDFILERLIKHYVAPG